MFAKKIVDSDTFLAMPLSTQALYFHLTLRADDDGFIDSPKKIQKFLGCSDDDFKILLAKQFVIPFESGIVVIKHWKIHNYIQKDRYKETDYTHEKEQLSLNKIGEYVCKPDVVHELCTGCTQNVSPDIELELDIDVDIEKESDKEKAAKPAKSATSKPAPIRHRYGTYNNVLLSDEQLEKLKAATKNHEHYIENLSKYMQSTGKVYKDHLATIRNWIERDVEKGVADGSKQFGGYKQSDSQPVKDPNRWGIKTTRV